MSTGRPRVVISIYDDEANPHYAGGGPVVTRRIAMSLRDRYDVLVVTAGRRWSVTRRDGIRHLHLPVVWAGPRVSQLLWAILLPVVALLARYDAWIESFTPPVSSNLVPLVTRRPVVGVAQALSGREMKARYGSSVPLWVEQRLLRCYRDIVVLNELDAGVVAQSSPQTRVHLIRNSIDVPAKQMADPQSDSHAGVHGLYLGRIDVAQKGLDLLLDAYASAGERALPLVLAGSGRTQEELRLRHLLHGHGPKVRWVGHVTGAVKDDLIDKAAFLVVSSREESFSLAALEAMARGRPVIHFDLPQLSWIPADCGIRVPRFEVESLAAAIERLSNDLDYRTRAGRCARAFAVRIEAESHGAYRQLVDDLLGPPAMPSAPTTVVPTRRAS